VTPEEFDAIFKLPFNEASRFFQQKLNIQTKAWDDLWKEQHARGFMSAGAMKAALLEDLRGAVQKAIDGKLSLKEFREQFDGIVEKHGWAYKGGRNWRSRLIWDTNITTSYQAGRWQQFQEGGAEYLRYVHADGVMNPRPLHLAWNGRVVRIDDPWVGTHYPPNGWGCHCRMVRAWKEDYDAATASGLADAPPSPIDPKTGAPVGIDKGWDYNVGEAGMLRHEDALGRKLATLADKIAEPLYGELKKNLSTLNDERFAEWVKAIHANTTADGIIKTTGEMRTVWFVEPKIRSRLLEVGGKDLESVLITVTDKDLIHLEHGQDLAKGGDRARKERIVSLDEVASLPRLIRESRAVLFEPGKRPALLYVFDVGSDAKSGKWVVRMDMLNKKAGITSNAVTSGSHVPVANLLGNVGSGKYILLDGEL